MNSPLKNTVVSSLIAIALFGCATGPSEGDLGFQALKAGNYTDAQAHLTKAIAEHPNDPYIQLNLGATYQNLGQYDLARQYLTQVLTTGAGIVPQQVTKDGLTGQSLADVAKADLATLPK
jgi:Tfp pilus assembly protein PilF